MKIWKWEGLRVGEDCGTELKTTTDKERRRFETPEIASISRHSKIKPYDESLASASLSPHCVPYCQAWPLFSL